MKKKESYTAIFSHQFIMKVIECQRVCGLKDFEIQQRKKKRKKDHFQTTKERGVNYFQNRKQQSINGVEPLNKEGKILYMWLAQLLTTEHKLSIL